MYIRTGGHRDYLGAAAVESDGPLPSVHQQDGQCEMSDGQNRQTTKQQHGQIECLKGQVDSGNRPKGGSLGQDKGQGREGQEGSVIPAEDVA